MDSKESEIQEESKTPVIPEPMPRRQQLIHNLAFYKTLPEAAEAAGYSKTYANTQLYQVIKSDRFQKNIRDYYKGYASSLLPSILQAEQGTIQILRDMLDQAATEKDPEQRAELQDRAVNMLAKSKDTLKQLKQSSGVLDSDAQSVAYITVDMRKLVKNRFETVIKRHDNSTQNSAVLLTD